MGKMMVPQFFFFLIFLAQLAKFSDAKSMPNLNGSVSHLQQSNGDGEVFTVKLEYKRKIRAYIIPMDFGGEIGPFPLKIDAARSISWMSNTLCRLVNGTVGDAPGFVGACYSKSSLKVPTTLPGIPDLETLEKYDDNGKHGVFGTAKFTVKPIGSQPADKGKTTEMIYGAATAIELKHLQKQTVGFLGLGQFVGDEIHGSPKYDNYVTKLHDQKVIPAPTYLLDHEHDTITFGLDAKTASKPPTAQGQPRTCNLKNVQGVKFVPKINGPEIVLEQMRVNGKPLDGSKQLATYVYLTSDPKSYKIKVPQCIFDQIKGLYTGNKCGEEAGLPPLMLDLSGFPARTLKIPAHLFFNQLPGEDKCNLHIEPHSFNIVILNKPFKEWVF